MQTAKTSREFHGNPISVRALCQLEDRSLPFNMLDILGTAGVRHFNGKLSTGDVDCTWDMTVWQNGFWSVTADFHDGGTLAGDFFFVEFLLVADHGIRLEGSILNVLDSRHLTLSKDGSDRSVRENWDDFEASGPSVRLHAAPSIGALVAAPIILLNAVPFVAFIVGFGVIAGVSVIVNVAAGKTFVARRCSNPSPTSTACVEFVPVEGTGSPGVDDP